MIPFYCLSHENQHRKSSMIARFSKLGLEYNFGTGAKISEDRMAPCRLNGALTRVWSTMYGHLDLLKKFVEEHHSERAIICEDDILIHKNIVSLLPVILEDFNSMSLDILLLGYLTHRTFDDQDLEYKKIQCKNNIFKYYFYPDESYGAQAYLITRSYAQYIIKYCEYPDRIREEFSSDHIITKLGKRGLIKPMLIVENGKTHYDHEGQRQYHIGTFLNHYIEGIHI